MRRMFILVTISTVLLLGVTSSWAGVLTVTNIFVGGQKALASEVNKNFNDVEFEVTDNANDIALNVSDIAINSSDISAAGTSVTDHESRIAALESTVTSLQSTVNQLASLLTYMTIDETNTINGVAPPHIIFEGVNLHVRNGSSRTDTANGLGNLIIGYNEVGSADINNRAGSHNVIIGLEHEYSTYGGFVAGRFNRVSSISTSISGGYNNVASGNYSSISGGVVNTASGRYSTISGGSYNAASGSQSSVSGGTGRLATGQDDWAAAGIQDTSAAFSINHPINIDITSGAVMALDSAGTMTLDSGIITLNGPSAAPAARVGDLVAVGGGATGTIIGPGSSTVLIGP